MKGKQPLYVDETDQEETISSIFNDAQKLQATKNSKDNRQEKTRENQESQLSQMQSDTDRFEY